MNYYRQRQLERLEEFVARKKASKEMQVKQFMAGISQESDSSIFALVYCTVPVIILILVVFTIALITKVSGG